MCNCPMVTTNKGGFLWKEREHREECTNPSANILIGFDLYSQMKGTTQYPTVRRNK